MTTSKQRPLCTLKFKTQGRSYEENLSTLLSLVDSTPTDAIVVAPEVCLTNFDYDRFDEAAAFAARADEELKAHSADKTVIVTMIEYRDDAYYNIAKVFHRGEIVHEQPKAKLFLFGGEHKWFAAGDPDTIGIFEVGGIRMGILICFELRFTALWRQLAGAEIIAVPAQWGKLRAEHFDVLGKALAIANECYVLQSDTSNEEMSGLSGIVTPFGACERNGDTPILETVYDASEVVKMRRYLDVGIC